MRKSDSFVLVGWVLYVFGGMSLYFVLGSIR